MSVRGNLIGVAAVACAVLLANNWISKRSIVAAEVVNQSDFLRTYNPVPLLIHFRADCQVRTGVSTGSSSTPGYRFLNDIKNVHYTRIAHMELCDQKQFPAVLSALHQNVISALGFAGCRIDADQSSEDEGMQINYRCGTRTDGFVSSGPKRGSGGEWPSFVTLQLNEEWKVRDPS